MDFKPLHLLGAWITRSERDADSRGSFERSYDAEQFAAKGITEPFTVVGVSHNSRRGTFRGLHFQWPPMAQAKLVRCLSGSIADILLDLRPGSITFMKHEVVSLDAMYGNAVYIPAGFAHGFQTLEDNTSVEYLITGKYSSQYADGYHWNDPAFGIKLPLAVTVIGERDDTYARFNPHVHKSRFLTHEPA